MDLTTYLSVDGEETNSLHASAVPGTEPGTSLHNTAQECLPSSSTSPTEHYAVDNSGGNQEGRTRQPSLSDLLQGGKPGDSSGPQPPKQKRTASPTSEGVYDNVAGSPKKRLRTDEEIYQSQAECEDTGLVSSLPATQLRDPDTVPSSNGPSSLLLAQAFLPEPTLPRVGGAYLQIRLTASDSLIDSINAHGAEETSTYGASSRPTMPSTQAADNKVNRDPLPGDRPLPLPGMASFARTVDLPGPVPSFQPSFHSTTAQGQGRGGFSPTEARAAAGAARCHHRQTSTTGLTDSASGRRSPAFGQGTEGQDGSDDRSQGHPGRALPQFTDPWLSETGSQYHKPKLPGQHSTTDGATADGESENNVRRWYSKDTPGFELPKPASFEHVPRPLPLPRRSRRASDTPAQRHDPMRTLLKNEERIVDRSGPLPPPQPTKVPWGAAVQSNFILPPLVNIDPPSPPPPKVHRLRRRPKSSTLRASQHQPQNEQTSASQHQPPNGQASASQPQPPNGQASASQPSAPKAQTSALKAVTSTSEQLSLDTEIPPSQHPLLKAQAPASQPPLPDAQNPGRQPRLRKRTQTSASRPPLPEAQNPVSQPPLSDAQSSVSQPMLRKRRQTPVSQPPLPEAQNPGGSQPALRKRTQGSASQVLLPSKETPTPASSRAPTLQEAWAMPGQASLQRLRSRQSREPREVTTPLLPDQTAGCWVPAADSLYGGTTFALDAPQPPPKESEGEKQAEGEKEADKPKEPVTEEKTHAEKGGHVPKGPSFEKKTEVIFCGGGTTTRDFAEHK